MDRAGFGFDIISIFHILRNNFMITLSSLKKPAYFIRRKAIAIITFIFLTVPIRQVCAGMPQIMIEDAGKMRLESISFFALALFGFTFLVKLAWNFLQKDFPKVPKLSYGKAFSLVFLISCLFMLILTMISGARELLTPGAWKKEGFTYKLQDKK